MPYLDGKKVNPEMISPEKHRFIGMFRPPDPIEYFPLLKLKPRELFAQWQRTDNSTSFKQYPPCYCPCGESLIPTPDIKEHWLQGHFDEPMYETIPKPETKIIPEEVEPVPEVPWSGPVLWDELHTIINGLISEITHQLTISQIGTLQPKEIPNVAELLAHILDTIPMRTNILYHAESLFKKAFFEEGSGKPRL